MGLLSSFGRAFHPALRREDGQVLVLQAVMLIAFMAVVGLVVDGGKIMVTKRQAQNAVDAAALAAAAHATLTADGPTCAVGSDCWNAAADYLRLNNEPTDPCITQSTNCFAVQAPYKKTMVRVVLHTDDQTIFAGLIGVGSFDVMASAAATVDAVTQPVVTPGTTTTVTTTFVAPGAPASIFVRNADRCDSFFFPGSGNHVTGVVTNGGVGNFPAGNVVDSILMNHYFYNQNNCKYPTVAGAPHPPSFWQYDANGNPLDGAGPDTWVVAFPDLAALMSSTSPAVHCLYSSHDIVGEVTPTGVTATTDGPHCLRTGDQVAVSFTNSRLGNGTVTVASTTATTFSYDKSGAAFSRSVTKKALKTGVATLTLSGTSPAFVKGDVISVSGVDGTFDCARCTVANASNSSVSYAIPGAADVTGVTSGGRVDFVGATGTETHGAIPTISSTAWKVQNPPGVYVVDAPYGTALTIGGTSVDFSGYTWVAPEILLSGTDDTFSNYPGAPQDAVFFAYNPNGDALHESARSFITGSIFCGPSDRPAGSTTDPANKCWFGGTGTTFTGLLEAWRIEWKLDDATFNGTGPPVGTTTGTTTVTVSTPASTGTTTLGGTVGGLGE